MSSEGINPFLIGAKTLKSDVPARLPDLIVRSRRIFLSPHKQAAEPAPRRCLTCNYDVRFFAIQLCLSLAIASMNWPTLPKFSSRLPMAQRSRVMVYYHGGGNRHGNTSEVEFNAARLRQGHHRRLGRLASTSWASSPCPE